VGEEHPWGTSFKMSRIHVVVEGPTEEAFVRDVLVPHFAMRGTYLTYSIVHTKFVKDGPNFVGGTGSYGKFKHDVQRILSNPIIDMVTSFLDFYALPGNFPGRTSIPNSSPENKVRHIELAIEADINNPRFCSYISLHEFEAMVFVGPEIVQEAFPETNCLTKIRAIRDQFPTPEDINDSPHTAPSKRLETIFGEEYQKTVHGPLITETIGLARLRAECPHFDSWVSRLELI
jgi:hypothetical protein